jgi:hypothetical protein
MDAYKRGMILESKGVRERECVKRIERKREELQWQQR